MAILGAGSAVFAVPVVVTRCTIIAGVCAEGGKAGVKDGMMRELATRRGGSVDDGGVERGNVDAAGVERGTPGTHAHTNRNRHMETCQACGATAGCRE